MAETAPLEYTAAEVEDGKSIAWLAYMGILFLIPLLTKPENRFCKAHTRQGIIMAIAMVIISVCTFISVIPFIGWCLGVVIFLCLLVVVVFDIIALIYAVQGQYYKIPLIGDLALKLKF